MKRFLALLSACSLKFPRATVAFALLVSLLSLGAAGRFLTFDTNQDHLISDSQDYLRDYAGFLKEFGDWEYVYVVIKADGHAERAKELSDALAAALRARPDLYDEVTEKLDVRGLRNNGLLLMPEKEFAAFEKHAAAYLPEMASFLKLESSADWYAWVNALLEKKSGGMDRAAMASFWDIFTAGLDAPFHPESAAGFDLTRLMTATLGQYVDKDGYLFSSDGKLLFLQVLPRKNYAEMEIIREPLSFLRQKADELRPAYPELTFGVTGRPVLQNDEGTSTGNDSQWASIGSLAMVAALFLFFVKDVRLSLFSLAALGVGIAWTTGLITLAIGSVNLLTIVFAVILIGMGMDYGVHFMLHYQLLKDKAGNVREAVATAIADNGVAILMGAGMTALGFATAVFTDFLGLQQLGFIVGVGIILCCLAQLTFFPALITLWDKPARGGGDDLLSRFAPLVDLALKSVKNPKATLAVTAVITLACLPALSTVGFDYNLLKLQDPTQESVRFEKMIEEESGESTWFLSAATADLDELKRWRENLEKLPVVSRTDSILNYVTENQDERLERVRKIRTAISEAGAEPPHASWIEEMPKLEATLTRLANAAFSSGDAAAYEALNAQAKKIAANREAFDASPLFHPPHEDAFQRSLSEIQAALRAQFSPAAVSQADLPPELLKRYRSAAGNYSIAIYPSQNVWEWEALENFISQTRSVIPAATGAPITTYESAVRMNRGFRQIGILTSAIVLVLLVLAFREIRTPLVIAASLVMTFLWLFGFMALAGIPLNLANFFALPILIGSNVDHGIYLFHHYREHRSLPRLFQLTVPPVFLSCFTNVVGFATLALVRHRGLSGFGMIMAMGTLISLIVTAVWIPCVIRVFYEKNEKAKI